MHLRSAVGGAVALGMFVCTSVVSAAHLGSDDRYHGVNVVYPDTFTHEADTVGFQDHVTNASAIVKSPYNTISNNGQATIGYAWSSYDGLDALRSVYLGNPSSGGNFRGMNVDSGVSLSLTKPWDGTSRLNGSTNFSGTVVFTVSEDTPYSITGRARQTVAPSAGDEFSNASISLARLGMNSVTLVDYLRTQSSGPTDEAFTYAGVLSPGEYRLQYQASVNRSDISSTPYQFYGSAGLQFTMAVPEPAGLLALAGTGCMLLRRRRSPTASLGR